MKKLSCTQCGAGINPQTLACEYCGSIFLSSNIETASKKIKNETIEVRHLENEELAKLVKTLCSNNVSTFLLPLIFMFMWTGVSFAMAISASSIWRPNIGGAGGMGVVASLVPFVFSIIGVSVIISIINKMIKGGITKELELIEQGKFQEAYESLKQREKQKHDVNFVAAIILLSYFKLNNFNEAKNNIIQLSQLELSHLIAKSNVILEISRNLGVKTPDIIINKIN